MVKSKPKTIDEVLGKVDPEHLAIAERLRSIVKTSIPDATETIRHGVITYIVNNKDLATISLYKDHVDLGLLVGSKLDDKRLKGKGLGKDIRHVKIVSTKNIDESEISRLLKEATALT